MNMTETTEAPVLITSHAGLMAITLNRPRVLNTLNLEMIRLLRQGLEEALAAAEVRLVLIAGAGAAAHLAGFLAAHTVLPVVGVPVDSSPLRGLDALLSTVQMPPGVPVAAMAVGKAGARNAGFFAVQILGRGDPGLVAKLKEHRVKMQQEILSIEL